MTKASNSMAEELNIDLERRHFKDAYTIGRVSIDCAFFCDSLEDKVRDNDRDGMLSGPDEGKIPGETAIPYGRYRITIEWSPRFKRRLPRLHGVKNFEGILIHAGNTAIDSSGCLLFGRNTYPGMVLESRKYVNRLIQIIDEAIKEGKEVYITIR